MKEDEREKERMDRSGGIGRADRADRRDRDGGLHAEQPDADARCVAHCPRQAIGIGVSQYSCERDGDGHCWPRDGYGLPVIDNPAVPDGWAIFVGDGAEHGYVYAIDLAKPDSGITLLIDADGALHAVTDRRGGES